MKTLLETPWAQSVEAVIEGSGTDRRKGLSSDEVAERKASFGANALKQTQKQSALAIFIRQFKSLIMALLAAAAATAFVFSEMLDGIAIVVVIFLNAAIGFFTELKAVRSMEALEQLNEISVRVRRDGSVRELNATELVPGDVVVFEGGDLVTADCRLIEASKLQANEAALTGESMPVDKHTEPVGADAVLAERPCMVFKGTEIARGSGVAVVTSTGMQTEIGEVTKLVSEAEDETTPLEADLDRLGNRLIFVVLAIAVVVATAGVASGRELLLMVETAIALAVAAIPEGLPIVATIALARGMWRMSRRNALVNHLSAVETLGSTAVICTDKTGTLTEGSMDVHAIERWEGAGDPGQPEADVAKRILEVGALCNNAHVGDEGSSGDPIEVALLSAARSVGINRGDLVEDAPEIREEAFDSDIKMMATFHQRDEDIYVAVKGAPEAVLKACTHHASADGVKELDDEARNAWKERNDRLAEEGFRLLAVAEKTVRDKNVAPYEALTLLGYVVFRDPPRKDVTESLTACRNAGIAVVMITGDQAATARTIAREVGLVTEAEIDVVEGYGWMPPDELDERERQRIVDARVFSRFSPRQKMDLIDLHQQRGSVVAMTGDGVNDAPALKKADIGVAMGIRGTQVAREASDMVLKDDRFSTIVEAVKQGRIIFGNIRNFVTYLLSCNMSEILVVSIASFLAIPLPILPLQILFLNLVTDIFPALALGMGEGDENVLNRGVRPKGEPIMGRRRWLEVIGYGLVMSVAVLAALYTAIYGLELPEAEAVTISFLTLALAQLWHVINMRAPESRPFRNEITANRYVWGALVLCVGLLLLAVYLPVLSDVLKLAQIGMREWGIALAFSLIPVAAGLVRYTIRRRKR